MSQHGFAESATITQRSALRSPSFSAGMSVKDKLSDYLTEIKFHTSPSSLKRNPLSKIKLAPWIRLQKGNKNGSIIFVQSALTHRDLLLWK